MTRPTIAIGRSLGDSFAWFFYHSERKHLEEHLKHERQLHMPPGIGGIGELEFLDKTRVIDNHLVIYHGTTTFLRIGDVSFLDMKTLRLTAIGELKTKEIGPKE